MQNLGKFALGASVIGLVVGIVTKKKAVIIVSGIVLVALIIGEFTFMKKIGKV